MSKSWVWVIAVALAIAVQPALAGYSSGRSSARRSTSSSHGSSFSHSSSSSSSSHKGSSYSSGKGYSSSGSFGAAAAAAKRSEESHSTFSQASPSPAPTPQFPAATATHSQPGVAPFVTRQQRARSFFGRYVSSPAPSYGDRYSPWFWLWLLDRPTSDQGAWLYHHRYSMDAARYDSVVSQNEALRQRIAELESSGVPRDPAYAPPGLPSADLMYADSETAATTQPTTAEAQAQEVATAPPLLVESETPAPPSPPTPAVPSSSYPLPPGFTPYHDNGAAALLGGLFTILCVGGIVGLLIALTRGEAEPVSGVAPPRPSPAAPVVPTMDDPLHLLPGQTFRLDLPEYAGRVFRVERVLHYSTRADGRSFQYTAYCGNAGGDNAVQLRVERLDDGSLAVLALHLHDQFEYDRDFYNVVATDGTGLFQITDDDTGEVTAEYRRPEGILSAYSATVAEQTDADAAPAVRRLQYWDYSRRISAPGGVIAEYLIVEMEQSGFFRLLLGPQIDPAVVRTTP